MSNLDRVVAFLESEASECPEPWMGEGLKEIDRLRKIATCFRQGDVGRLFNIYGAFQAYCNQSTTPMSTPFVQNHLETIYRLQAAAKLAEGGA